MDKQKEKPEINSIKGMITPESTAENVILTVCVIGVAALIGIGIII